jgi:hypothetical protein
MSAMLSSKEYIHMVAWNVQMTADYDMKKAAEIVFM